MIQLECSHGLCHKFAVHAKGVGQDGHVYAVE